MKHRTLLGLLGMVLLTRAVAADPAPVQAPAAPVRVAQAESAKPLVSAVYIEGLKLIDESIVRGSMQLKVGAVFDENVFQQDVNAVYDLGWFYFPRDPAARGSVISTRQDADGNVEIHMLLVENPVIGEIRLHGQPQLPKEAVEQGMALLRVGRPLNTNERRVNAALRQLEQLYREQTGAVVRCSLPKPGESMRWYERPAEGETVIVNIRVEPAGEGPAPTPAEGQGPSTETPAAEEPLVGAARLKVTKIEFRGLKNVSQDLCEQLISTKVGDYFDWATAQKDIDELYKLGKFYRSVDRQGLESIGYPVPANPEIGSKVYPAPDRTEGGVVVIFMMVENPVIKEVNFVGNTLLPDEKLRAPDVLLNLQPGSVFNVNPDKLEADYRRVRERYEKDGYIAFVEPGAEDEGIKLLTPQPDGTVTVTLKVIELKVGRISFDWGEQRPRTKERVFRSYLRSHSGDYFNWNTIFEDLNEIRRLDILEDIKLREPDFPRDDPTKLDLTFEVTEKRTGQIAGGGGISSRFGLVGYVDVSQNNLWGMAQRAAVRVEFGGRFNFSTSYFWPLLDGHGTELQMRLYNTEDRTGATGFGAFTNRRANFDQVRRGASLLYSRPIIAGLRGSAQYQIENVSTQRRGALLPNLPPFPFQDVGSDTTSSMTFAITNDRRDLPFDSSRGMYQMGSLEWAGLGGDNSFQKYRIETRHYWPLFGEKVKQNKRERPAWVLATRARAGFSTGDLPFSQSYFIGGSESLRGYTEDRFFGDREFLFNLELRRVLPYNLMAAAFFDAGRAWRKGEKVDFFDDLASSVGVSLRVTTPVGPLRFDIGFGGEGNRTHFSFGQPF